MYRVREKKRKEVSDIKIPVIFEDDDFLVVDKPSGLTVNDAQSTKNQETLQGWIMRCHPEIFSGSPAHAGFSHTREIPDQVRNDTGDDQEFFAKNGIVHRLDKDTSGLIVIAKNVASYEKLKAEFQERRVVKKYLTLVHGVVEPKEGEINAPIERSPVNRTRFGVFPSGREAKTSYKVIKFVKFKEYPKETYSYLGVEPKTGRTHQIRVHLKYLGHSVVSDPLYAGRKQLARDLKICPRLFLHAAHLEILGHSFDSSLPEDLENVLK